MNAAEFTSPVVEHPLSLHEIENHCWQMLRAGCDSGSHPFHLPAVASSGPDGVELRTVVLRRAEEEKRLLGFHTDVRSAKWQSLRLQPQMQWLFYSAPDRVQLRIRASAQLHQQDTIAREAWDNSPVRCRRVYMGDEIPGAPSPYPTHGLPDEFFQTLPSVESAEKGWDHFGVVITRVETIEWLQLSSRGHLRASFHYRAGEAAQTMWMVP